MAVLEFWNAIHESGQVVVSRDSEVDQDSLASAIASFDANWRLELAYEAPELNMPVAQWAVMLMYKACQFLVFRDVEADVVRKELSLPTPEPMSAEVCYSADIALRILPDLFKQARGLSEDDVLVLELIRLARVWPLSSVGIPKLTDLNIDLFIDHPSLRRLYADRIIRERDSSRISDPRAAAAVRGALGGHPELAPSLIQ